MQPQGQYPPQQGYAQPNGYQPVNQSMSFQQQPMMMQPMAPVIELPHTAQGMMYPGDVICKHCNKAGRTRMELERGRHMWYGFCLCCFCGLVPCAPCVLCRDGCKDHVHYCSHCNKHVGRKAYKLC